MSVTLSSRKILFVINPVSGNRDKESLKRLIENHCNEHGTEYKLYFTTDQNDRERIKQQIEEFEPGTVAAAGGDGTINMVAPLLVNTSLKLGILPTGSANGMAFEMGIPANLTRAMDIIMRGETETIDLLRINQQHLAVHLSDIGMNARIIKRFDREKIRGLYGYARQFFKEYKLFHRFRGQIRCPGQKPFRFKAIMVTLLNTRHYGIGAIINPAGDRTDGRFEIVVIKPYPWYYLFRLAAAFFTGTLHKQRYVKVVSCTRASIVLPESQELQIDGEPMGALKEVNVEIVPAALKVIKG